MKPIKLVIKGLNSFIEEQTIDFEKLTDRGLFGIFGPTGSGKSTILDGITLALYGDIARKSSNFINTNCNDLSISFKFQISGNPDHIYTVSRQFKRDKKTGNAKTHSASVKEITHEGEEILAESATAVTKMCKEILGLSLEDFTRTVVLPQGKFSEFLKLEGKQRREMLERLFNLQEYGDRLGFRLSNKMKAENEKLNQLIGQLNTYEDISEEQLNEQKTILKQADKELEELKQEQAEVEKRYKQGEEIWNLQKELREYNQREQVLFGQAERMKLEEEKLKKGEGAQRVNVLLEPYEQKSEELVQITQQSRLTQESLVTLDQQKEKIESAFKKISQQKEEELPDLKSKGQQLKDLLEENQKVIKLEMGDLETDPRDAGISQILEGLQKVQQNMTAFKLQEAASAKRIDTMAKEIVEAQNREEALKVDRGLRNGVEEGLRLLQDFNNKQENYDKSLQSEKELLLVKTEYEQELKILNQSLEKEDEQLNELLTNQEAQLHKVPISSEELMKLQEELASARESWKRLEAVKSELALFMQQNQVAETEHNKEQNQAEEKRRMVEQLKNELEEVKLDYYAYTLREHLQQDSPCPVCGSSHHLEVKTAQNQTVQMKNIEEKLRAEEKELEELQSTLAELKVKLSANKLNIERLENERDSLDKLFKEQGLEEQEERFAVFSKQLKAYEEEKADLEGKSKQLKEARNQLDSTIKQKQAVAQEKENQLVTIRAEKAKQLISLDEVKKQLDKLKADIQVTDLSGISQEIKEKDQAREKISTLIKEQIQKKEEAVKEREILQDKLNKHKGSFERGLAKFDEKQKSKQDFLVKMGSRLKEVLSIESASNSELKQEIGQLFDFLQGQPVLASELKGIAIYKPILDEERKIKDSETGKEIISSVEVDALIEQYPLIGEGLHELQLRLHKLIMVVADAVRSIEREFAEIEIKKDSILAEYELTSKALIEFKAKEQSLQEQLKKDLESLNAKLEEEGLTTEEVKQYFLDTQQLTVLRENINQYRTDCAELAGAIRAAKDKLGDRKIEPEDWNQLQSDKQTAINQVEEAAKRVTNLTTLVKGIEEALARMGKLREEKKKIDHQIAILTDLDKLFKGKRFVEFVAVSRLKYVSLEASKKLKEITNGNYGLEVDEGGKFIIRDYKNGGAQRDASTLSGGETFLASLALALALSAEIQLKGTAPLELFFLDEGFGTLDDELLDVVMGSLEKIHHDKLKVGIISHVESIKNRVPVKLLLTPAESGRGGTKVKLERS